MLEWLCELHGQGFVTDKPVDDELRKQEWAQQEGDVQVVETCRILTAGDSEAKSVHLQKMQ